MPIIYTFKLFYLIFETILRYVGLAGRDIHDSRTQRQSSKDFCTLPHAVFHNTTYLLEQKVEVKIIAIGFHNDDAKYHDVQTCSRISVAKVQFSPVLSSILKN